MHEFGGQYNSGAKAFYYYAKASFEAEGQDRANDKWERMHVMLVTRIEAMAMNFRCRACDLLKQLLWDSMPHSSLAINASGVVGNSTSRQAPHHPFYLHLHPISCNSR